MAHSLTEYIKLVAEDGRKAEAWKKAFLANSLRDVKAGHHKVVTEVSPYLNGPHGDSAKYEIKDADNILRKFTEALAGINRSFTDKAGWELDRAYSDEHHEYWDPEMFADGQKKEDYPRKPMDNLFEPCQKASNLYSEFWRRFYAKWDFGSMNVTLLSFLPHEMRDEADINMDWLKQVHEMGLVVAMTNYEHKLQELAKKISHVPEGGSANAVGVGLSSLLNEAKSKGDQWTVDFAHSLMDQARRRKPFSDKQKAVVNKKLHDYGIPAVNYDVWW